MRSGSPVPLLLALVALLGSVTPVAGVAGAAGVTAGPADGDPAALTDPAALGGPLADGHATSGSTAATSVRDPAGLRGTGATRAQQADEPAVDGTTFRIEIQEDGNARVSVIYAFRLHGRNETQAFTERTVPQFENGSFDSFDDNRFRSVVSRADEVTDRSMAMENVARNGYTVENPRLDTTTGYLALNFTWTNFAERQGSAIRVGDAFNASMENSSETGTWLPYLRDDQTLIIVPPPGYGVDSASVRVRPGAIVRWDGPQSFAPGDIEVEYERNRETPTPVMPTPEPPSVWERLIPFVAVGIVLLTLLALGAYAMRRRDEEPGAPASANGGVDDDRPPSSGDTPPVGTGAEPATREATDPDPESAAAVDPDLLSDEERIERLLRRNGGRMKQANIVRETGWSNAKVSQLLSAMDESERVDKLRIGRENLISLPDEDDY